jgi:putative NADPH-quinone reductase
MKTLIIITHPDLSTSRTNKRWIEELQKHPDKYRLHDLYQQYPDEKIDVPKEQQLVEAHDKIIFQFPFYWFNCPPLLKKWLDEVMTYGWAYGSTSGYKMQNKKIALAMTVGIEEKDYREEGRYKYTLAQLTTPFEITFAYVKANYRPFFAYYGLEFRATDERIEESTHQYLAYIDTL